MTLDGFAIIIMYTASTQWKRWFFFFNGLHLYNIYKRVAYENHQDTYERIVEYSKRTRRTCGHYKNM